MYSKTLLQLRYFEMETSKILIFIFNFIMKNKSDLELIAGLFSGCQICFLSLVIHHLANFDALIQNRFFSYSKNHSNSCKPYNDILVVLFSTLS